MGPGVSAEREVKLAASPAFRMPSLAELGDDVLIIPRDPTRLQTVYFDTGDFRLARWGVSLRHRQGQGWTVKIPAESDGDLLVRGEFAFPGEDAAYPPDEALDLIRAYVRTATLKPVVRLRTIRRLSQLLDMDDRLLADVVDDEVSVLSGRRIAARFRELEVEITDDTPPWLLEEVLGRLRSAGAGAPDPTPKYVRAVGPLATQQAEVAVQKLPPGATVGDVLRRAIGASTVHLLRSDAVMRLDVDPEGVHQARVATRRLRSDLRTFRDTLDPEWSTQLREELRWLGTALGEARDADVLFDRLQRRAVSIPATEAPGVAQVIDALAQRRKEAHAALLECLRTERYVALLDRLVEASRDPRLLPDADVSIKAILPGLLDRPWGHLRAAVKEAGSRPTDGQLHAIRIRAKRVRYAAEAVAPLMGKPARRFAEAAARLQTVLGEHNDAVVAESWLRSWAADRRSGDAAFAAGMLAGIERAAAQTVRDGWRKTWKALDRAKEAM
jgi:CHAD domain-containing protein